MQDSPAAVPDYIKSDNMSDTCSVLPSLNSLLPVKTENNNNTPQLTKENTDKDVVEPLKQQEITEVKDTTNTEEQYTEIEVSVAEKKECDGNKHGISSGNTGLWFETKDKAIEKYKAEIKIWGDKWTNDEISDDEYYKNCPYGYESWSCPYCGKWTLNYYLNN